MHFDRLFDVCILRCLVQLVFVLCLHVFVQLLCLGLYEKVVELWVLLSEYCEPFRPTLHSSQDLMQLLLLVIFQLARLLRQSIHSTDSIG